MLDKLKKAANSAIDGAKSAANATSDAAGELNESMQVALINKALDAVEKTGREAMKRDSLDSITVGAEFSLGPISLRVDATFRNRDED